MFTRLQMRRRILIVSLCNDLVFNYQKIIAFDIKGIDMCQIVSLLLIYLAPKLLGQAFQLKLFVLVLFFHLIQFPLELMQFLNRLVVNLLVALVLLQQILVELFLLRLLLLLKALGCLVVRLSTCQNLRRIQTSSGFRCLLIVSILTLR